MHNIYNQIKLITRNKILVKLFVFLSTLFLYNSPIYSQTSENTNNQSRGTTNSFTITVNSTHGVQTNVSKTKDFNVDTYANLVVGSGSTSIQENKDGASAFLLNSPGSTQAQTSGVSGFQRINFGEGTRYEVKVTAKTREEICGNLAPEACIIPELGTASGSATGSTSTSVTVNSSETNFINSFIRSFTPN